MTKNELNSDPTGRIISFRNTNFSHWLSLLKTPLYRNGLALVFSLISTSGLGIIFWALAARNYSPTVVGTNSAIISAMGFLANASQFGLVNFLTRFLPKAGNRTKRMVIFSYVFSVSISLAVSVIFVLGLNIWSPSLRFISENPLIFAWFVSMTVFWCIFALQDGVLVGLRQATWVPVENVTFALVKIGLLLIFARVFVEYGIFASWTLPVLLIVLVINYFIIKVFIPRHTKEIGLDTEKVSPGQIIRFVGGDYISTLVWMATVNLMPLIIINKAGPEANAFFYLPWMITYSLYLVSRNFGMSLTVEAAKDQTRLLEYSRHSLMQTALLLLPIILIIMLGAPWLLKIFGDNYADEGANLLRFLSLSALPYGITSLYISIARVRQQVSRIVIVLTILCILAISLTLIWLEQFGLVGVGMAWLVSQMVVAGLLVFTGFGRILFPTKNKHD